MDRRTEKQLEGYADSCLGCIFGGIIGLIILSIKTFIGLVIGLFVKTGEKNPEDELRKYRNTLYKRQQIEGIVCPKCETKNEEHQTHCYMCGSAMMKQVRKTNSSNNTIQIAAGVAVILVVAVIVFSSKWEFSQTVNVQASNQNKQIIVNSPTATTNPQEIEAVIRNYLAAVANGECEKAGTYFTSAQSINSKRCDDKVIQVYEFNEIVFLSHIGPNSRFLVKGDFQIENEVHDQLYFDIIGGKIRAFPKWSLTPTPTNTPAPIPTATITPTPTQNVTDLYLEDLKILSVKYLDALVRQDCEAAWSYFPRDTLHHDSFISRCSAQTLSYEITEFTYDEASASLTIHGNFTARPSHGPYSNLTLRFSALTFYFQAPNFSNYTPLESIRIRACETSRYRNYGCMDSGQGRGF